MAKKIIGNVDIKAKLKLSSETADRVPFIDTNKEITSSNVNSTELSHLQGVTSNIQTQLNSKVPRPTSTDKAIARYSGTNGDIQDSGVIIDNSNNVTGINNLTVNGTTFANSLTLPNETANTVPILDNNKELKSSVITPTELSYLQGVTSNVQTQINSKINLTEKGAPNGVATLDGGGKVPVTQLPSPVMTFEGTWDASTNTPTLTDGVGDPGMVYQCVVAGTVNFGSGNITFAVGDWVIYDNNNKWVKSINSNSVVSVNGYQGIVNLTTTDIPEGTNQYFTDEKAQDAVGNILTDTNSIDFTYDDTNNIITADVKLSDSTLTIDPTGLRINNNQIANIHISNTANINRNKLAPDTADSVVINDGSGNLSNLVLNNTQIIVGQTGNSPKVSTLTAGVGININDTPTNLIITNTHVSNTDIPETSFNINNNQNTFANVIGFNVPNTSVRAFKGDISVFINASTNLYAKYEIEGINKGASWELVQSYIGDDSEIIFDITPSGQLQYQSGNYAGFISGILKFKVTTLQV
jgi:hypothetical protein